MDPNQATGIVLPDIAAVISAIVALVLGIITFVQNKKIKEIENQFALKKMRSKYLGKVLEALFDYKKPKLDPTSGNLPVYMGELRQQTEFFEDKARFSLAFCDEEHCRRINNLLDIIRKKQNDFIKAQYEDTEDFTADYVAEHIMFFDRYHKEIIEIVVSQISSLITTS